MSLVAVSIARKKIYLQLTKRFGSTRIKRDEPLSKYSTLKVGGPADLFFTASASEELVEAIKIAKTNNMPVTILGGATNLVIADRGIRGLVIKNESNNIRIIGLGGTLAGQEKKEGHAFVEADSGVLVNQLVRYTIDDGLGGLEPFLGQPGTIGGAIYINAHNMCKGAFFGDNVYEATLLDQNCELKMVPVSYFGFGYDESSIQQTREIVVAVKFRLTRGIKDTLWKEATEAMNYRSSTQPLGFPSSGCTFRNIKKADAIRLETPGGTTSAGYLIDKVGLKGKQVGGAKFSDKHANFIVNVDNATAHDVVALIREAKEKVREKFGVDLHEEVVLIGEF